MARKGNGKHGEGGLGTGPMGVRAPMVKGIGEKIQSS